VSPTALLVVDMVNPYDFEDADNVAKHAAGPVKRIAELIKRADAEDVLIVYVNDNYGDWNASRDDLLWRALHGEHPELVEPIQPPHEYPFIWKPRHSAFYETALGYLLSSHDIERVVLTGQVTEQCILYSALDAYIRHFDVVVPKDAVVPIHPHLADAALEMVRRNMRAETPAGDDVELYSAPTR
jgi:nicotinamidase-related amidase